MFLATTADARTEEQLQKLTPEPAFGWLLILEGVSKRYPEIGGDPPKGSIEPLKSSIEPLKISNPFWPPKTFYKTPGKEFSEPQTGFHLTFRIEPPFQLTLLKPSLLIG